eukprot:1444471-Pyramimonas_sp.AAC.1
MEARRLTEWELDYNPWVDHNLQTFSEAIGLQYLLWCGRVLVDQSTSGELEFWVDYPVCPPCC